MKQPILLQQNIRRNGSNLLSSGRSLKEFAQEIGAHPESLAALYRKLKAIERFPFITKDAPESDVIDRMMEYIDRGTSIIIEFGNYTSTFCYLLIANIITRRIHSLYIQKTENFWVRNARQMNQRNS